MVHSEDIRPESIYTSMIVLEFEKGAEVPHILLTIFVNKQHHCQSYIHNSRKQVPTPIQTSSNLKLTLFCLSTCKNVKKKKKYKPLLAVVY